MPVGQILRRKTGGVFYTSDLGTIFKTNRLYFTPVINVRTVRKLKSCRSRVFAKSNTVPFSKITATNMILFEWEVNLQMGGFTVLDDNHVQHANVPHKSADHTVIFWCFFRSQAAIPQLPHFGGGSFTTLYTKSVSEITLYGRITKKHCLACNIPNLLSLLYGWRPKQPTHA